MGLFTQKISEVKESSGSGSNQKYIYGGVYNHVTIDSVTSGKSANKGTPFIEFAFYTKEGGKDALSKQQMYLTPNTIDNVQAQIKHIATKIVTEAELESGLDDSTPEALASSLNSLLKGQSLRMQFNAQEYINSNNEVKEKATIPLYPPFAEAIQTGAEYEVVEDADTELKFSKDDKYQFKKVVAPTQESEVAEMAGIDDI